MNIRIRTVLFLFLLLSVQWVLAQQKPGNEISPPLPSTKDSIREVHLIRSDLLKFIKKDTVEFQILVGNAMLRQENTFFNGDSIVLNKQQNIIEVFGNIHINDADSVNVYSQYLIYYGNSRLANLQKNVKLSDGKATLTTEELEYDLNSKTGSYLKGGKIVTSSSTLTSNEGYYYADTKDAYFRKNVKLVDPEYTMATDTLLYNTNSKIATFVSPTTINDGKSIIRTSDGYYDMDNGLANFGKRPVIEDSAQQITADNISFDKNSGKGKAVGNVTYIDTAQGVTLFSEKSDFNRDSKTVLATGKPVMIMKQDNDSIFITGDSLYSGIMLDTVYVTDSSQSPGSTPISIDQTVVHPDSMNYSQPLADPPSNTLQKHTPDKILSKPLLLPLDTTFTPADIDSIQDKQTERLSGIADTITINKKKDIERIDSVRFFQAYHHVRIFSDSMQAVSDSMFFSGKDSTFRLFTNPIVWAKESQITGDTIYLYTKNKKPDHIEVLENAFSISRSNDSFYNQLKGNVIHGFFTEGEITHILAKGSAESLYYLQDEDSAYTGANYAQADLINLYFKKKELDKITWLYEVKGGFYPVTQVPEEKRRFRNFRWEDARRPKTRMEIFQ